MSGMSLIVKTVTRITAAIIFLFGCYITLTGHFALGGGFAGGIISALGYILYVLAYGKSEAEMKISQRGATLMMCLGMILFLALALLGFSGGYFFKNFLPKGMAGELVSGGIIPFCNFAIMLEVGAGLYLVFLRLITFNVIIREEEE